MLAGQFFSVNHPLDNSKTPWHKICDYTSTNIQHKIFHYTARQICESYATVCTTTFHHFMQCAMLSTLNGELIVQQALPSLCVWHQYNQQYPGYFSHSILCLGGLISSQELMHEIQSTHRSHCQPCVILHQMESYHLHIIRNNTEKAVLAWVL